MSYDEDRYERHVATKAALTGADLPVHTVENLLRRHVTKAASGDGLLPDDRTVWPPRILDAANDLIAAVDHSDPEDYAALWLLLRIPDCPWADGDALHDYQDSGWLGIYHGSTSYNDPGALMIDCAYWIQGGRISVSLKRLAENPEVVALIADALRIAAGLPPVTE